MTSFRKTILFAGNFAIKNKIIRKIASFKKSGPSTKGAEVTLLPVSLADSGIFCIDGDDYASLLDDVSNNLILYARTNPKTRLNYDIKNHHNYCTMITNNDIVTSSWNIHDDNNQQDDILDFLKEYWFYDFTTKSSMLPLKYYNLIRYIISEPFNLVAYVYFKYNCYLFLSFLIISYLWLLLIFLSNFI